MCVVCSVGKLRPEKGSAAGFGHCCAPCKIILESNSLFSSSCRTREPHSATLRLMSLYISLLFGEIYPSFSLPPTPLKHTAGSVFSWRGVVSSTTPSVGFLCLPQTLAAFCTCSVPALIKPSSNCGLTLQYFPLGGSEGGHCLVCSSPVPPNQHHIWRRVYATLRVRLATTDSS